MFLESNTLASKIMNCCDPANDKKTEDLNDAGNQTDEKKPDSKLSPLAMLFLGVIVGFIIADVSGFSIFKRTPGVSSLSDTISGDAKLEENLPSFSEDVTLPVKWGDLGVKMAQSGVVDAVALEKIYESRGGLDNEAKKLLYESNNGNIVINQKNSGYLLNLFWALGIGNKNAVLDNGPMQDKQFGGAANFASTGGWTLAKGDVMNHYSKHNFFSLTPQQQALVEKVSQGIYRPCCGNSTYFPDCNHGMAMLGLLELMASQGASEEQMYKTALIVNSYWFPDNYKTIAKYMAKKGVQWENVDPKEVLGVNFSSGQGYNQILNEVEPVKSKSGGSCGV